MHRFLTNNISSFEKTFVSETGLSNFSKRKYNDEVTYPETETKHY